MITVIVKYKYPQKLNRTQALERFKQASEAFKGMDGLNSKQFTFDEETGTCLTVYNWVNREKAEAFFSDDFILNFEKIVGTKPTFEMFDCLLMVDNRADDIILYE